MITDWLPGPRTGVLAMCMNRTTRSGLASSPWSVRRRLRYFKIPPLSEGDWAALGFRQKDNRIYISTLRSHIEATSGRLDITAHFPKGL
jgi:hypothetical protein